MLASGFLNTLSHLSPGSITGKHVWECAGNRGESDKRSIGCRFNMHESLLRTQFWGRIEDLILGGNNSIGPTGEIADV
jgi:hypothetical protein